MPLQVWSQETYYTDCAQPPLLYEDGEFKRVEIFGRKEFYQFPEPFGLGPCICHDHEEVTTLPRLLPRKFGDKGLRYVDFKMGTEEAAIDGDAAFVGTGMTSKNPVTLKDGTKVRPIDVYVATLAPPTRRPTSWPSWRWPARSSTSASRSSTASARRPASRRPSTTASSAPTSSGCNELHPRRHLRVRTAPRPRPRSTRR